jgi:hypothetical protein
MENTAEGCAKSKMPIAASASARRAKTAEHQPKSKRKTINYSIVHIRIKIHLKCKLLHTTTLDETSTRGLSDKQIIVMLRKSTIDEAF